MGFLCFAPCARYFPRPPQTPLMHYIPPYWANITIIFFRADSDWHCVQRVLRTLLVNFPLLVFPLECRHPRERLALLRVGACAAQLSATRAHSNTAAPGMRRDCPENATLAKNICQNAENAPRERKHTPQNANSNFGQHSALQNAEPRRQAQTAEDMRCRSPSRAARPCARALAGQN